MALLGIAFCDFDAVVGPCLRTEVPEGFLSDEDTFDALSEYLLPKPALYNRVVALRAFGHTVVGLPTAISHSRYPRNAFVFNIVFRFHHDVDHAAYIPVLRSLASALRVYEEESQYLFKDKQLGPLRHLFSAVMRDLNHDGNALVALDEDKVIALRIVQARLPTLPSVQAWDVPVPVRNLRSLITSEWDVALQRTASRLDGVLSVAKIAAATDMDIDLVTGCVARLVECDLVHLVDIFQYTNRYAVTEQLNSFAVKRDLVEGLARQVVAPGSEVPKARDVITALSCFHPGNCVLDIAKERFAEHIDLRRLVAIGVTKGILRRIHAHPLLLEEGTADIDALPDDRARIVSLMDGTHCMDELCTLAGKRPAALEAMLRSLGLSFTIVHH